MARRDAFAHRESSRRLSVVVITRSWVRRYETIVPPESFLERAIEIGEAIASNAPLAVEGTKAIGQWARQSGLDESYRMGDWVSRVVLESNDAKEGPRAFAEKRPARWTGT